MAKPKKYKTGDVVTKKKESGWDYYAKLEGAGWALVSPEYVEAYTCPTRELARLSAGISHGDRIARVIKETPKTVTVVISK